MASSRSKYDLSKMKADKNSNNRYFDYIVQSSPLHKGDVNYKSTQQQKIDLESKLFNIDNNGYTINVENTSSYMPKNIHQHRIIPINTKNEARQYFQQKNRHKKQNKKILPLNSDPINPHNSYNLNSIINNNI